MKKITKFIFLLLLSTYSISCFNQEERIASKIQNNLKEKYGEDFEIRGLGKRSFAGRTWYECIILPSKYVGTTKEYDSYYRASGFYTDGSPGDSYGRVFLQESANEFYSGKIRELFGNNFISAILLEGGFDYKDWKEELARRQKLYAEDPEGNYYPISGAIYVFGRVNSDKDREFYREKIHKFIEFMKETGSFEYVAMWIVVLDERVLSDAFTENEEDQERLLALYNEKGEKYTEEIKEIAYKNPEIFDKDPEIIAQIEQLYKEKGEGYLKEKAAIMDKYTESYDNTSEENKQKRIEKIGKSNVRNKVFHNVSLMAPLFSPKHVKNSKIEDVMKYNFYDKLEDTWYIEESYYKGDKNE